jgi:hypothetical protein
MLRDHPDAGRTDGRSVGQRSAYIHNVEDFVSRVINELEALADPVPTEVVLPEVADEAPMAPPEVLERSRRWRRSRAQLLVLTQAMTLTLFVGALVARRHDLDDIGNIISERAPGWVVSVLTAPRRLFPGAAREVVFGSQEHAEQYLAVLTGTVSARPLLRDRTGGGPRELLSNDARSARGAARSRGPGDPVLDGGTGSPPRRSPVQVGVTAIR